LSGSRVNGCRYADRGLDQYPIGLNGLKIVMAGLDPAIHEQPLDARNKSGHDSLRAF